MKLQRLWLAGIASGLLAGVVGCSSTKSTMPVYDTRQTGTPISVQKGRVTRVQDVLIKGASARPGSLGPGATIGAGVVSGVLGGGTRAVANAVGGVVGGAVGARADDKYGEEITIEMEGGRTIIIVQERGDTPFSPDDRVQVQSGGSTSTGIYGAIYGTGGNTRVVRDDRFADSADLRR